MSRTIFTLAAVAGLVFALAPAVTLAADGTWDPPGDEPPGGYLWSTSTDWMGSVIADGVGATAQIDKGGGWYTLVIDSDRTLGSWVSISGGNPTLTTSNDAVLTWDTGDGSEAVFAPFTGSGYNMNDDRNMYLESDLDWGNDKGTQREHNLRGVISGPGKLMLNFYTNNYDGFNHGRLNIGNSGDAKNTYSGGTEIGLYSQGTWGFYSWNDPRVARLRKDGALGTGDVTMTHIHSNLEIQNDGPDPESDGDNRIDDGAALKLISGYDPNYPHGGRGYFHTGVILNTDVNETVDSLYMNGYQAPAGTYDAISDPLWFEGEGVLTVTNGPAAGSYASTGAGNWNAGGTWGGTAPSYFDDSSVGHDVAVAADAAAKNVAFTGGSVTVNAGQTLLVQDTFNPSGGTTTVNGTLETANLASTTGLTLAAGSTLTVGKTMVVDSAFDPTPASTLQLPGGFEGDTIEITSSGTLTLGADLNRTRNLKVSGTLDTSGNVMMQYGGRLSGGGTIKLDAGKRVEICNQGHWQITQGGTGGVTVAPGDSVGTLTIQDGEFTLQSGRASGDAFPRNKYEWEIGQQGAAQTITDVVSVENGKLNLSFSNGDPDQILFKILDAGGYVAHDGVELDLFTYDADSTIEVNEDGSGMVQGLDAGSFDTSDLDPNLWTIGDLQMHHEAYGGGGGHVYLTGLSGGMPIPEPATLALVGLGALGTLLGRRRRKGERVERREEKAGPAAAAMATSEEEGR